MRNTSRTLVVASGYYGFGNLGDEAILEELTQELSELVPLDKIVILSASPAKTAALYGVRSADRWNFIELASLLSRASLFISGGGGLFQDTRSPGSPLYYGGQIVLARALGARPVIWGQGLGPLSAGISKAATRCALSLCEAISVRDKASFDLTTGWGLKAILSADPVWRLAGTAYPQPLRERLAAFRARGPADAPLVGLSLRPSGELSDEHLKVLAECLGNALPEGTGLVLLPLQKEMDEPVLRAFQAIAGGRGQSCLIVDSSELPRPSQWISLIAEFDLVVAMRLHALVMAIKSGVAVAGIAYDPKVKLLLSDCRQPILNLTKEVSAPLWDETIKGAFAARHELSAQARAYADVAKNLACQNFNLLVKMLDMQRGG